MTTVSFFCTGCGRRVKKIVDEDFPPSTLQCRCGARFPLAVEEEEPRSLPEFDSEGSDTGLSPAEARMESMF
jgi:hypothetical protein